MVGHFASTMYLFLNDKFTDSSSKMLRTVKKVPSDSPKFSILTKSILSGKCNANPSAICSGNSRMNTFCGDMNRIRALGRIEVQTWVNIKKPESTSSSFNQDWFHLIKENDFNSQRIWYSCKTRNVSYEDSGWTFYWLRKTHEILFKNILLGSWYHFEIQYQSYILCMY